LYLLKPKQRSVPPHRRSTPSVSSTLPLLFELRRQNESLRNENNQLQNANSVLSTDNVKLNSQIHTLNSDKATLQQTINALNSDKSNLQQTINTLNGDKSNLQQTINTINTDKSNLQQTINNLNSQINTLNSNKITLQQTINTLNSDKSNLQQTINTLNGDKSNTQQAINLYSNSTTVELFKFLRLKCNNQNPHTCGLINLSVSSTIESAYNLTYNSWNIFEYSRNNSWWSNENLNQSLVFNLKGFSFKIEKIIFDVHESNFPKRWQLCGSNDNYNWTIIHNGGADNRCQLGNNVVLDYTVQSSTFFKSFRLVQLESYTPNFPHIHFYSIEFIGRLQ
jgi:prefoldin subunit 5